MDHSTPKRIAKLYNLDEAQLILDEIPTDRDDTDEESDTEEWGPAASDDAGMLDDRFFGGDAFLLRIEGNMVALEAAEISFSDTVNLEDETMLEGSEPTLIEERLSSEKQRTRNKKRKMPKAANQLQTEDKQAAVAIKKRRVTAAIKEPLPLRKWKNR